MQSPACIIQVPSKWTLEAIIDRRFDIEKFKEYMSDKLYEEFVVRLQCTEIQYNQSTYYIQKYPGVANAHFADIMKAAMDYPECWEQVERLKYGEWNKTRTTDKLD